MSGNTALLPTNYVDGTAMASNHAAAHNSTNQVLVNLTVYNPLDYGAKGDTKVLLDGAITAGTNQFSSLSASFTAADIGKVISIWGAGPTNTSGSGTGAPGTNMMQSTITAVSGGVATLSGNATNTVTGQTFVYGSNDKSALDATMAAAYNNGGGLIDIVPGRYRGASGDTFYVKNGCHLVGHGWGSTAIHMGVSFGTGVSGASAPLTSNASMRGFMLDGTGFSGNQSGIGYTYVQDCHIDGVYVNNVPFWSVVGSFSNGTPNSPSLYIDNCIFDRGLYSNNPMLQDMTAFNFNSYIKLRNVEFRNNGNGYASCLFYNWQNIVDIDELRFVNCGGADTCLNVNGNIVTVRGLKSDGGTHQIFGQILYMSDFQDEIGTTVANGANYKVRSMQGLIVGGFIGQRRGANGSSNASTFVTYDSYSSMTLSSAGYSANGITAGTNQIVWNAAPPGFYNNEKIVIDGGASQETFTILSGAGTNTWTMSGNFVNNHSAGVSIKGVMANNIHITKSRIALLEQNYEGLSATCTLRVSDTTIASGDDTIGFVGLGGNQSLTLATTATIKFDNVRTCGGITFNYFAPTTNQITYTGYFKNVEVYNNHTAGFPAAGKIELSQIIAMRFENCDVFSGFSNYASLSPTYTAASTLFRNIRNPSTLAPLTVPAGVNATPGATPSVPASTTPFTNNTMVDAWVYISGGTVTVIAVGGTTTGLTSGAVFVPSGQTITLTYSVAPTWAWIGV